MVKTLITSDSLKDFGMKLTTEDPIFPMRKTISIGDKEDGEIMIAITKMRNKPELCLSLPDGAIIYLNIQTIEELEAFEKCIESWDGVN
ncbi:MAG: hypothetical protein ACI9AT_000419 [Ulvibacter sp.]|jgi:hypothetical protein